MKAQIKNTTVINTRAKVNSTVKVDKKLDTIKNIKFTSNKPEEINKLEFKLSFK